MSDFQYTTVPGKLKDLFSKIKEVGVPEKATFKWLESVGFKSTNDRGMLKMLAQIGFIEPSGSLCDRWKKYKGADYQQEMAKGIKEGYKELFVTYPDAQSRNNKELEDFFSTRSIGGKQVISKTVNTFRALCELADFNSTLSTGKENEIVKPTIVASESKTVIPALTPPHFAQELHIDIQIHISPDTSPELIDKIFTSMANHLYPVQK